MKKNINSVLMLCIFFMLIGFVAYSQVKPPTPIGPPPPPGLPIDGGLSILLIAGIAYGVYEKRRKK
jgi:hypothetical protein